MVQQCGRVVASPGSYFPFRHATVREQNKEEQDALWMRDKSGEEMGWRRWAGVVLVLPAAGLPPVASPLLELALHLAKSSQKTDLPILLQVFH